MLHGVDLSAMVTEGYIKFDIAHEVRDLEPRRFGELSCRLIAWREIMALTHLVGQDPNRYEGAGFGNVSARIGPPSAPLGQRGFLITATQTSGLQSIDLQSFVVVSSYDIAGNRVTSYGRLRPSSESMTHGAIYDQGPHIRAVLHAHSPILWLRARQLGLPVTDPAAAYGSPEMAREVRRMFRETNAVERQVMVMGGHEDGILAFGRSPEEAGGTLLNELARAHEAREAERQGLLLSGRRLSRGGR